VEIVRAGRDHMRVGADGHGCPAQHGQEVAPVGFSADGPLRVHLGVEVARALGGTCPADLGKRLLSHLRHRSGLHDKTQFVTVSCVIESTRSGVAVPKPDGGASPRRVLIIVCAGVILASLDLFIVNVALPQIARDLGAKNLGELSWVLNGYAIVYASLLVFFGRLADRYRRDRGFLLGVAVFTAASAACAASTTVGMLIGFRIVQAAGAALLTPTSLALVLASYPPERRHGAIRAWTATGGLAAALGPVVGGLLVSTLLTLIVLPAMYHVIEHWAEARGGKAAWQSH